MAPRIDFTDGSWTEWTDWRWTASPILTVGGLHGSILFCFFILIAGAALRVFLPTLIGVILYAAFLVYCARKRRTPYRALQALYVVFVQGAQWRAR